MAAPIANLNAIEVEKEETIKRLWPLLKLINKYTYLYYLSHREYCKKKHGSS